MAGRRSWLRLTAAARWLGGVSALGAAVLALPLAAALGFRLEDGMEPVRAAGVPLGWWLLGAAAVFCLWVPVTRRAMGGGSWREAASLAAASCWQGAKKGLMVGLALGAAGLLAVGLLV